MKIYVASSWRNEQQPEVVRRLREMGFEVYDFRNPEPGDHGFSWKQVTDEPKPSAVKTREVLGHPIAERGFALDFNALLECDAVLMLQPCGMSAAIELAWAAGASKLTIALLADGCEPELMLKVADFVCVTFDEAAAVLNRYIFKDEL